jgi:hypothetical protein
MMNLSGRNMPFNVFGHYTEMFAVSGAISELLLQSVDGIIRVFPAWPKKKDAEFKDLRAQGGFLISAKQKDAEVTDFEVTSTVGGRFRFVSPWKKVQVESKNGGAAPKTVTDKNGIAAFETKAGEKYVITEIKE